MFQIKLFQNLTVFLGMIWTLCSIIGLVTKVYLPILFFPFYVLFFYFGFKTNNLLTSINNDGIVISFSFFNKKILYQNIVKYNESYLTDSFCPNGIKSFSIYLTGKKKYIVNYKYSSNAYEVITRNIRRANEETKE
ncbi:hypothetical protein SAMN06295933_3254 [Desulfovibrio gilichinskyi]|uniref:PH domain-containing protein n=1 Tax=Desulfovibrio gilichinskyi TaxID=1519643 RepID=A0A1X7ERS0_9BACT|nr:hypothetical protein SAMN06295933_3254 [Desulfovibrio gilichinskyi]